MSDNFLIRDVFNSNNVFGLGENIKKVYPDFNLKEFRKRLNPLLKEATFSERKSAITTCLVDLLPNELTQVSHILIKCLPPPYEGDSLEGDMDRFIVAPMADTIAEIGLSDFRHSMDTLYIMTQSFSAEWAIRPFIEHYPDEAHPLLLKWTEDTNAHVRRLVSEGTRPYLPWGKNLSVTDKDPEWSLALLEKLINDPSKYVRTSVANHLNDLTRKHPNEVLAALGKWKKKMTSHKPIPFYKKALRNMIKAGNPESLKLIGFSPDIKVLVAITDCPSKVSMGEKMTFHCDIRSTSSDSQEVLVDFIIHFHKKNGKTSPKVFKLNTFTLTGNDSRTITKSFSFKPITTRKYYPGPHKLEIMVNGKVIADHHFDLV